MDNVKVTRDSFRELTVWELEEQDGKLVGVELFKKTSKGEVLIHEKD